MSAAPQLPDPPPSSLLRVQPPETVYPSLGEAVRATMQWHAGVRLAEIHLEVLRRVRLLQAIGRDPVKQAAAREACRADVLTWVNDWCWTFDPRNAALGLPTDIPLVLRPKQAEFVQWVEACIAARDNGVIEKSRDEGGTWVYIARAAWRWRFTPGWTIGLGSRKADLVDKKGDPKSMFEKIRFLLDRLPAWLLPRGWNREKHATFGLVRNPENGSTFAGEAGDEIGRGGRCTEYLVDEHASIEHAEKVEASLSQNATSIFYLSTPKGVGNLFYRKAHDGKTPKFTFFWKHNPDKNFVARYLDGEQAKTVYAWYEEQRRKYDEVLLAQEVDINYNASVEGIVIPGAWVDAAFELDLPEGTPVIGGLDVSDSGPDKTTYAARAGPRVRRLKFVRAALGAGPAEVKALALEDKIENLFYDRLGVGAQITATLVRASRAREVPFRVRGIANSQSPSTTKYPDLPDVPADERFFNYAAELWWRLRLRFRNTYERAAGFAQHPDSDCISLYALRGTSVELLLRGQLSQPTYEYFGNADKIRVEKKGQGTISPDLAEALMYAFARYAAPEDEKPRGSARDLLATLQATLNATPSGGAR